MPPVPRVLLLLPSTAYRAADFLDAARGLGAEVVLGSDHEQALGQGDPDRAMVLDYGRPQEAAEAIVGLARTRPLDAVVPTDDQGVVLAAIAAERLGLTHNPPLAARASTDKAAMRAALAAEGVPQPRFRVVRHSDDAAAAAVLVGLPCVLKPVSLSASRGVIRADDRDAALAAAGRIRTILAEAGEDPEGPLLVERYVPGAEVALEGLLGGGELEPLALFDKPDPLEGPTFEETIYVTPSRLPQATQEGIRGISGAAAGALGLREGPVHAEVRLGPDGPAILEIAARSIGGLCSRSLRFGAGISLEELILRHALGLPTEGLRRERAASGVMMLPIPREGVLREVRGQQRARAVPGIVGLEITIGPGRPVRPLPEADRYLGFLFARGETPEAVEEALRTASNLLEIDIRPG